MGFRNCNSSDAFLHTDNDTKRNDSYDHFSDDVTVCQVTRASAFDPETSWGRPASSGNSYCCIVNANGNNEISERRPEKLPYMVQARHLLFYVDDRLQTLNLLHDRLKKRLRVTIVQQRIYIVKQANDMGCCRRLCRSIRRRFRPNTRRFLVELRSRLSAAPLSNMREDLQPGELSQRIRVLSNRMPRIKEEKLNEQDEENHNRGSWNVSGASVKTENMSKRASSSDSQYQRSSNWMLRDSEHEIVLKVYDHETASEVVAR